MDSTYNIQQATGIVILNYNNYYDTINCIKSLIEYSMEKLPYVVIVDNCSTNNSVKYIAEYIDLIGIKFEYASENSTIIKESKFLIIKLSENIGYARGNNVGLRLLINNKVENICILNNDILFKNNAIEQLTSCLNKHPEIGFLSPLLVKPDGKVDYNCCRKNPTNKMLIVESLKFFKNKFINKIIDKKYLLKTNNELLNQEIVTCDIISGACIMSKRNTWEIIQYFDPNTFLYYEENILYEKLKKKTKLKSAIYTKATIVHLGAQSTTSLKNTKLLQIEIDSMKYYFKTYRSINLLTYYLILIIKKALMFAVELNNKLKAQLLTN